MFANGSITEVWKDRADYKICAASANLDDFKTLRIAYGTKMTRLANKVRAIFFTPMEDDIGSSYDYEPIAGNIVKTMWMPCQEGYSPDYLAVQTEREVSFFRFDNEKLRYDSCLQNKNLDTVRIKSFDWNTVEKEFLVAITSDGKCGIWSRERREFIFMHSISYRLCEWTLPHSSATEVIFGTKENYMSYYICDKKGRLFNKDMRTPTHKIQTLQNDGEAICQLEASKFNSRHLAFLKRKSEKINILDLRNNGVFTEFPVNVTSCFSLSTNSNDIVIADTATILSYNFYQEGNTSEFYVAGQRKTLQEPFPGKPSNIIWSGGKRHSVVLTYENQIKLLNVT